MIATTSRIILNV